jgi:hypothetical protein
MVENPFALSEVTEAERRMLGDERIASGVRLACQAHIREGDCIVRVLGPKGEEEEAAAAAASAHERILEEFAHLPTAERLSTAIELQLKVAGDLLTSIAEVPLKAGEELFASIFGSASEGSETESKGKEGDQAEKPADGTHESHE